DIPHFFPPSVEGHSGQIVLGKVGNKKVAALKGRVHFYEGHTPQEVVHPTRVLKFLGINTLVLTNASGGIADGMQAGDFMIIKDHLNLTGQNPLIGPNLDELGPRFPDMSEAYNKELRQALHKIFKTKNLNVFEGVYCGVLGPSYETPAEIQMLKTLGGGAVGMSTVLEAIAAKHMGLKLAGLSCITNLAAGISDVALSHDDVKDVAQKVEKNFSEILTEFITTL
ncbi:MAG: purine-nucleoside phosphorylase, partial [Bdellovibrionales bacterium]|nr:purine-nucleoside phosphorylase [Bdellovibrionales bacterium]